MFVYKFDCIFYILINKIKYIIILYIPTPNIRCKTRSPTTYCMCHRKAVVFESPGIVLVLFIIFRIVFVLYTMDRWSILITSMKTIKHECNIILLLLLL